VPQAGSQDLSPTDLTSWPERLRDISGLDLSSPSRTRDCPSHGELSAINLMHYLGLLALVLNLKFFDNLDLKSHVLHLRRSRKRPSRTPTEIRSQSG
jgi:hypothetical protein